jgi:hypothetical protein
MDCIASQMINNNVILIKANFAILHLQLMHGAILIIILKPAFLKMDKIAIIHTKVIV